MPTSTTPVDEQAFPLREASCKSSLAVYSSSLLDLESEFGVQRPNSSTPGTLTMARRAANSSSLVSLTNLMEALIALDDRIQVSEAMVFLYIAAHPGQSGTDIAQGLSMEQPRISRHLKLLCEKELIERPKGERGTTTNHLSKTGEGYLAKLSGFIS